jgi:hypothetical protein
MGRYVAVGSQVLDIFEEGLSGRCTLSDRDMGEELSAEQYGAGARGRGDRVASFAVESTYVVR